MGGTSMEDVSLLRLHHWAWACSDGSIGPFLELYAVWLVVVVPALTGALIVPGVLSASQVLAFLFTA